MPITELNHFLLVAKNLERTKEFYQKVLGLELAERPDFGFPVLLKDRREHLRAPLHRRNPTRSATSSC